MIKKLTITDPNDTPINYINEIDWLRNNVITFKHGLNLIIGENGTGKTTLLSMIAMTMHCYQGGNIRITKKSIKDLVKCSDNKYIGYNGYEIEHDNSLCYYLKYGKSVGMNYSLIDDDFFEEGLKSIILHGSDGELSMNKIVDLDTQIKSTSYNINNILEDMDKRYINYNALVQSSFMIATEKLRKNTKTTECKTILLDEPDGSMSIINQEILWKYLLQMSSNIQLITTSHSVIPLGYKNINIIETSKDYYKNIQRILKFKEE